MIPTFLNSIIYFCYINKLQLSLYTIGDRAIETALNAHEYALEKTGIKGLRHRMEHVELASLSQIKRAKNLGIIFSMNPTYERYWGGPNKMYSERLGKRYVETNKFREIIDSGLVLCGGSDSDVCDYNPFVGIHSAVNHPVKKHRISLYEAIKIYTINGAYAIFEENNKEIYFLRSKMINYTTYYQSRHLVSTILFCVQHYHLLSTTIQN